MNNIKNDIKGLDPEKALGRRKSSLLQRNRKSEINSSSGSKKAATPAELQAGNPSWLLDFGVRVDKDSGPTTNQRIQSRKLSDIDTGIGSAASKVGTLDPVDPVGTRRRPDELCLKLSPRLGPSQPMPSQPPKVSPKSPAFCRSPRRSQMVFEGVLEPGAVSPRSTPRAAIPDALSHPNGFSDLSLGVGCLPVHVAQPAPRLDGPGPGLLPGQQARVQLI